MNRYKNLNGDSGVAYYECGYDYILVKFSDGSTYKYTYYSAGVSNVEQMKILAARGSGLNSFINRNVRKRYETVY